jgi:hypothetical protein
MTPEIEEVILDVVNETPGIIIRRGISAGGCHSFDCLESVVRTTAVSLVSTACTELVTTRLPSASNVLPVVLTRGWYKS